MELSYDEWRETYRPIKTIDTLDTEELSKHDPQTIWTYCDSSGEGDYIVNGRRWVNRLEYYVTEKPWAEDYVYVRPW